MERRRFRDVYLTVNHSVVEQRARASERASERASKRAWEFRKEGEKERDQCLLWLTGVCQYMFFVIVYFITMTEFSMPVQVHSGSHFQMEDSFFRMTFEHCDIIYNVPGIDEYFYSFIGRWPIVRRNKGVGVDDSEAPTNTHENLLHMYLGVPEPIGYIRRSFSYFSSFVWL